NAGAIFNFGYLYRRNWWRNWPFAICYFGMMATVSILALMDPNPFSCLFRINCGNPDILVDMGYSRPVSILSIVSLFSSFLNSFFFYFLFIRLGRSSPTTPLLVIMLCLEISAGSYGHSALLIAPFVSYGKLSSSLAL